MWNFSQEASSSASGHYMFSFGNSYKLLLSTVIGKGSIPNILFFPNWQPVFFLWQLWQLWHVAMTTANCQSLRFHQQDMLKTSLLPKHFEHLWRCVEGYFFCCLPYTVYQYTLTWKMIPVWLYHSLLGKWIAPWWTCEALPTSSTAWYCQELSYIFPKKSLGYLNQCCVPQNPGEHLPKPP